MPPAEEQQRVPEGEPDIRCTWWSISSGPCGRQALFRAIWPGDETDVKWYCADHGDCAVSGVGIRARLSPLIRSPLPISLLCGGLAGSFDPRLCDLLAEYTAARDAGNPIALLDEAETRGTQWPGAEHQDKYAALVLLEAILRQADVVRCGGTDMPGPYSDAARATARAAIRIDRLEDPRGAYCNGAEQLRTELRAAGAPQALYKDWPIATGRHVHVWLPWRSGGAPSRTLSPGWQPVDVRRCTCGVFDHEARFAEGIRESEASAMERALSALRNDCPDPNCQREAGHPPPHRARYDAGHGNVHEEEWDDVDPNLAMLHDEPNLTARPETDG